MFHGAHLSAKCVYGVGFRHFVSIEDANVHPLDDLLWTCPQDAQKSPWLDVDNLSVIDSVDYDSSREYDDLSDARYICEGEIGDLSHLDCCDDVLRYNILSSGTDREVFEFTVHGPDKFDVSKLIIHYKTLYRPIGSDMKLVTALEYDGALIYKSGDSISNEEMPNADLMELGGAYTISNGWYMNSEDVTHGWSMLNRDNARSSVVIPAWVDVVSEDAFDGREGLDKLYIREGADIDYLTRHVNWDCVKVPNSQSNDFFEFIEMWDCISNGFFSGDKVKQPEFTFKNRQAKNVRWMELRPREFQYVCSLAFDMPIEECEAVGGRWLFTHSLKSGNLLLQLASAFLEGRDIEQDFSMALRCCEQAIWCAEGDIIPFESGEIFAGIEIDSVNQFPSDNNEENISLLNRANRIKEDVLSHFQRLDIRDFERIGEEGNGEYYRLRDHAFEARNNLIDVLLPEELKDKHVHVGQHAFAQCINLRTINVLRMADGFSLSRCANSFEGCYSLSDRIQYSLDGEKIFFCLNATEETVVCNHINSIGDFAFMYSSRLRDINWEYYYEEGGDISESRTIGTRAFESCEALLSVCTGGRNITLGAMAFADCRWLCEYFTDDEVEGAKFLDITAEGVFEGCENMNRIVDHDVYLIVRGDSLGAQFARCKELRDSPPIITTHIPQFMFEGCEELHMVECINVHPEIIRAVSLGKRPSNALINGYFVIDTRAFANCRSLEQFKFCRLRVSLRREAEVGIEKIDDQPKRVLFGREAFLGCEHLNRYESSFSSAIPGSDSMGFRGCPQFDGFID